MMEAPILILFLEVFPLLLNADILASFPIPVPNYPNKGNFKGKEVQLT